MKRIPFTIEAWKAGGVPVNVEGFKITELKQLSSSDSIGFKFVGKIFSLWALWAEFEIFLEVPCTKYYTHYYRDMIGSGIYCYTGSEQNPAALVTAKYIKTVEVEL